MINLVLNSLPNSLELKDIWNYHHFLVLQSMHQSLVRIDDNGDIVGDLASKWNILNGGKTYHFSIKKDCLIDEKPLTARDVIYSLKFHLDPKNKSVIKKYLDEFLDKSKGGDGIELLNEFEFNIYLKAPYEPFISILALPGFSIFKENGKLGNGSGPMKLKKFDRQKGLIELEKNPNYCGPKLKTNLLNIWDFGKIDFSKVNLKEDFDVFLGNGVIQKFPKIIEHDFAVTKSKSVSFLHLFPNAKNPFFKDGDFRNDFNNIFQESLKDKRLSSSQEYMEKISTIIPKGVLLPDYYKKIPTSLKTEVFAERWKSHLKKTLKVVLTSSYFTSEYATDLRKVLLEKGISAEIKVVPSTEIMKALETRDYDLISLGYIGNYPDPDGLLDPFYYSGGFKYVNYDTSELEHGIRSKKNIEDPKTRLTEYARTISSFESKSLVFPGFQLFIPFIHNKKVSIPDTTYRYEGEIWNIFWEK